MAERTGNSGTQFLFCMPYLLRLLVHVCTTTMKKRNVYLVILFSGTMNQIVFEMSLSYL